MFQERQTTHFATVTSSSNVSFTKDEDGSIWVNLTDSESNKFTLNLGKNPTGMVCSKPMHKRSAIKLSMNEDPIVGQTYIVDLEIPEYCSYADQDVYHLTGTAYAGAGATQASVIKQIADTMNSMNQKLKDLGRGSLVKFYAQDYNTSDSTTNLAVGDIISVSGTVKVVKTAGVYNASNVTDVDITNDPTAWTSACSASIGKRITYQGKLYVVHTAITSGDTTFPASKVTDITNDFDFIVNAAYNNESSVVIVEDEEQEWQLGFIEQKFVDINPTRVRFSKIVKNGNPYYEWGKIETINVGSISMTKTLADMEFQHIANRYDVQMNNSRQFLQKIIKACGINTKDSDNVTYDTLRIKCTYHGDGHAVQDNYFELIIAASDASNHSIMGAIDGAAFVDDSIAKKAMTAGVSMKVQYYA